MAAILAAWIISLLRMTAVAVMINPGLLRVLAPPVLAASFLLVMPAILAYRASKNFEDHELVLKDPLDLLLMLRLTALVAAIMLLSKLFAAGPSSLFALGGVSGLLDVDPITLSMARLAGNGVTPAIAVSTILIAAASNGLAKSVMALGFGGPRLGLMLGLSALAAFAAGFFSYNLFG